MEQVIATAEQRASAVAAGDAGPLTDLLHEDFRWTSHAGETYDRTEYVRRNTEGHTVWRSQQLVNPEVVIVGEVAVLGCPRSTTPTTSRRRKAWAAASFISVWCTRRMPATKVTGRHVRIEATLDGVVITRSKPRAQQHNVQRADLIGWDRILGARVELSRSGRPVVRLAVSDTAVLQHHKDDPFAVKLKKSSITTAQEFVAYVTHEVDVRVRWRKQA